MTSRGTARSGQPAERRSSPPGAARCYRQIFAPGFPLHAFEQQFAFVTQLEPAALHVPSVVVVLDVVVVVNVVVVLEDVVVVDVDVAALVVLVLLVELEVDDDVVVAPPPTAARRFCADTVPSPVTRS